MKLLTSSLLGYGLVYLMSTNEGVSSPGGQAWVYFGTYTGAKSKGIYCSRFDSATGKLTAPELAAQTANPSFLALHPNHQFLYAVGELSSEGKKSGAVSAFSIDKLTGRLTLLNQQSSGGAGPCHLALDRKGKCVLVANYGSGTIAALPVRPDGGLGDPSCVIQHQGSSVNPQRQAGPHAHFITADPASRFALVCDLGLDKVLVYRLDSAKGLLSANEPASVGIKPGSGPRHLAFHPDGRLACVINEMGSTLGLYAYDPKRGKLRELHTLSTLPEDFKQASSCAEVEIHPSGRFVYGSNRGHDSVAIFAIDPRKGQLTLVGHQSTLGNTPRHFAIDPSGRWLLAENQQSGNVVVFRIDLETGKLTPTGQVIEISQPVCALFTPGP